MKSPVDHNNLSLTFFCYVNWFDETRQWTPLQTRPSRQILLFLPNNSLAVLKLQTEFLWRTPKAASNFLSFAGLFASNN